ncbi:hypothetical protein BDN72DRAFT_903112 [Pluteus cervinus]|uniref:Uncharacterized protein n=1 Tax=Pluteus cervinus TaxID=181527 RepID=A0ACD3AAG6_9AGAR|nr:hypothetical protein BDN72DRAFT_903112 [Pluteus cervinus]
MSQLRSLVVMADPFYWPSNTNPKQIFQWLNCLSCLEFLDIPIKMLQEHHDILFFPSLRRFRVSTWYSNTNGVILKFLERHPELEKLTWFSHFPAPSHLPEHFLPKLRYLDGRFDFFQALTSHPEAHASAPRRLEKLFLNWPPNNGEAVSELCRSSGIDHDALRVFYLSRHQNIQDAQKLADAFPMLEELSLPNLEEGEVFNFDEFLLGLERLPHLKILYEDVIWSDLGIEKTRWDSDIQSQAAVDERIQILARRCPNLVEISHPKLSSRKLVLRRNDGMVFFRPWFALGPLYRIPHRLDTDVSATYAHMYASALEITESPPAVPVIETSTQEPSNHFQR